MRLTTTRAVGMLFALVLQAATAAAAGPEDPSCRTVRFADSGWSDVGATTGLASVLLQALGYRTQITRASVPVTFAAIKNRQIDAFLGYWAPAMTAQIEPFVRAGQLTVLEPPHLADQRHTLAVPEYLYERGLRSFEDIARFERELGGRIHGADAGGESNALIAGMLREGRFGLQGFTLVEQPEARLLYEVQRAVHARRPIVFLGWEPHPMNQLVRLRYLAGGDAVFGPHYGAARVHAVLAPAFAARCPNVATLLRQLRFDTTQVNQLMLPTAQARVRPEASARDWLRRHPAALEPWLAGVVGVDGHDGLEAVRATLGP